MRAAPLRASTALLLVVMLVPQARSQSALEPAHAPKHTPAAHQDRKAAMLLENWQQHMRSGHGTKVATQYHFAYARHLAPFNQGNITMLEVGANQGDSLFAWAHERRGGPALASINEMSTPAAKVQTPLTRARPAESKQPPPRAAGVGRACGASRRRAALPR